MHAADDFLTTLNAIRTLPISGSKRYSLAAAYTQSALRRRSGGSGPAEISVWGLRHLAPSWRSAKFLLREIYVDLPYQTTLARAKVIFDVGANCGFATLFFKSTYPDATIVAIEPQRREADFFRRAVTLNRLDGIDVINAAVGSEAGQRMLSIVDDNSVISSLCTTRAGNAHQQPTEVVRLSTLLPDVPVDLMKMDIEGAEHEVLRELADSGTLSPERIRNLVIEVHRFPSLAGDPLIEILTLLTNHGYDYSVVARTNGANHQQDVLVYCSPAAAER